MVTPFTNGRSLRNTKAATQKQKKYWKNQISEAVRALHENDLVWGDVNARNVMIESGTDRVVLIDFAGGFCRGWIDDELRESKAGDMQVFVLCSVTSMISKLVIVLSFHLARVQISDLYQILDLLR